EPGVAGPARKRGITSALEVFMRTLWLFGAVPVAVMACSSGVAREATGSTAQASFRDDMPPPSSVPVSPIAGDAVFVVNGGDQSISVVGPASASVVSTIQLENVMFPHHIYLSPDRSKLAVADPGMDMSGGHHGGNHDMQGAVLILD